MPTSYLLNPKTKGSIYFGIISSFLSLIILGLIPFLGWLLAGVFGGMAARGKGRGFVAAFLGGLIVASTLIEVSYYVHVSSLGFLPPFIKNYSLYTQITNKMDSTRAALIKAQIDTIVSIILNGALITGIGGLIGGSILPNENTIEN